MTSEVRDIRQTVLLGGVCIIGSVAMPVFPPLGLSLIGIALTRLRYAVGITAAGFVAAMSVGLAAVFGVTALILVLVGVVLALALARQLKSMSPGLAIVEATIVLATTLVAVQALGAWLAGTTLVAQARAAAEVSASLTVSLVGGAFGSGTDAELATLTDFFFRVWPADYVFNAIISGVLLVMAIGWGGRASGVSMRQLPRLGRTDLDASVLWLPVVAVGLLIAGRLASGGRLLEAVGLNVLLAIRPLFLWQGMGVVADRAERGGRRDAAKFGLYVVALLLDLLFMVISVLGLLDMRFNFRRLSRGDDPPGRPAEDMEPGT